MITEEVLTELLGTAVAEVDVPNAATARIKAQMRSDAAFIALRDHVTRIVRTEAIMGSALSAVH